MPNINTSERANAAATLLGALLESKGPLAAWAWSVEQHGDLWGDESEMVATALGRLVYSGMPVYHAIALIETARTRQYTALEIAQFAEAVRKLLLLEIPVGYVSGLVGCLLTECAKIPISEAVALFDAFRDKVLQGAESDRVYLELMCPPASLLKQSVAA